MQRHKASAQWTWGHLESIFLGRQACPSFQLVSRLAWYRENNLNPSLGGGVEDRDSFQGVTLGTMQMILYMGKLRLRTNHFYAQCQERSPLSHSSMFLIVWLGRQRLSIFLDDLVFTMWLRLTLNSLQFSCLGLLNAMITDMDSNTW